MNISDPYYFENATAKMSYDSNGIIRVYKNNTLIHTSNITYSHTANDKTFFASNVSGNVKKVRVLIESN